MKKQLTTLILTAALGIFAGASSWGAGEADIYDITPCDKNGVDFDPGETWSSLTSPLGSGETVYFKLRLIARQIDGGVTPGRWYLDYTGGVITEEIAKYLYPMQIGIYVSGVKTWATLDSVLEEGGFTTTLIFKYTTKPGDFAMPIRLATATGPAGDSEANSEYVFDSTRSYWKMRCPTVVGTTTNIVDCAWLFTADTMKQFQGLSELGRAPNQDYSLEGCGIFVQTVDFDPFWEVDKGTSGEAWRTIHENSTITGGGISPRLAISAPSEESRTFYVWSDDETKVRVDTANTVTMKVEGSGTMETFHVGKVTFPGGSGDMAPFLVKALSGTKGETANLILSAYSNFNWRASNPAEKLIDYITVPVKCIEALPASIVAECADKTVVADSDYMTAKTSLSIYLSQATTNDVTVTLKTTFTDDDGMTNWWDYVRFSAYDWRRASAQVYAEHQRRREDRRWHRERDPRGAMDKRGEASCDGAFGHHDAIHTDCRRKPAGDDHGGRHVRGHDGHQHRLYRAVQHRCRLEDPSRNVQGERRGRRTCRPHQQPPPND